MGGGGADKNRMVTIQNVNCNVWPQTVGHVLTRSKMADGNSRRWDLSRSGADKPSCLDYVTKQPIKPTNKALAQI